MRISKHFQDVFRTYYLLILSRHVYCFSVYQALVGLCANRYSFITYKGLLMTMKNRTIQKVLAVILTLALVAILLSQIEITDVLDTLTGIEPVYLVAGFGLYVLSYLFRALRFHILLNREVGIKDLFNIVCIHNMVNSLLPARTGELSYVYLLKKRHNKTAGAGAATLITARLFDMITILMLFFISTLFVSTRFDMVAEVRWMIIVLMFMVVLVLIITISQGHTFVILLRKIANHLGMGEVRILDYVFRKMDEATESFSDMHRDTFAWSALVSIVLWLVLYSVNYTLIIAMGIDMPFWIVLFSSTFAFITTILPVQGIGGFGTIEGGWAIGFIAVGMSKEFAISSGFSVHIIVISYILILGLIGRWIHDS